MYVRYEESFDAADLASSMIGIDVDHTIGRCPQCESMNVIDGYHSYQKGMLVCQDCRFEYVKVQ